MVNYSMEGLSEEQACEYVRAMLCKAGDKRELFDAAAGVNTSGASGRSIHRLNMVVVNALIIDAQQQASHIDSDMVFSAA